MPPDLLIAVGALAVSAAAPFLLVPWLRSRGAIDHPNHRSSHTVATVRGVGLAPLLGVAVAILTAAILGRSGSAFSSIGCAAAAFALIGLAEDLRGLTVRGRLLLQLTVGGLFSLVALTAVGPDLHPPVLMAALIPLLAVLVAGYVNLANFMDGIDSISALHGAVAGLHFCVVGWMVGSSSMTLTGAVTTAVFVGFAPWNLRGRVRVFLGDVGSYLLGALVIGSAVWVALSTGELLLAAAPTIPYLVDTVSTLARRARDGQPVAVAHRDHTYQRLTTGGLGHLTVGAGVAALSVLCSAAAVLEVGGVLHPVLAWTLIILGQATYLVSPRLLVRTAGLGARG